MLPSGYVVPDEFLFFMALIYGLPPLFLMVGLVFKKPGDPDQFGPPPQGKSIASGFYAKLFYGRDVPRVRSSGGTSCLA